MTQFDEVPRVRRLLAGTDPAPATRGPVDEPGRAALARILAASDATRTVQPQVPRRPGWRLAAAGLAVAASVTAVAVAAPIAWTGQRPPAAAYAATPPLLHYTTAAATSGRQTSRELLLALAATARRGPAPAPGRYDYIRTSGWYLDSRISGGRVASTLNPTRREQWTSADGSGRIEETRSGQRTSTSQRYGPGGLAGPKPLPTQPRALRAELAKGHPNYGAAEWLTAVNDVWTVQVVPPRLQAALLRMLAGVPGLSVKGTVVDRAGRRGVAVTTRSSSSGLLTDYTMIFDPRTGRLLDFEQTLLAAGKLHVRVPATASYTVWLRTTRVPSTQARSGQ